MMMKNILAVSLLLMFVVPVYAESAREICREEVVEAGIEDQDEAKFYVDECVTQMTTEMESGGDAVEPEADRSEAEPPQTTEL